MFGGSGKNRQTEKKPPCHQSGTAKNFRFPLSAFRFYVLVS
jgi:hypothetical protein